MNGPWRSLLEQPSAHNLGRSVRLGPKTQTTLVDLAGDDAAARSVHVVLSIAPVVHLEQLGPDELGRGLDLMIARAIVELGSGGHRISFEVDVGRGLGLTLSGSSLRVILQNDSPAPVELGAFVSYSEARSKAPMLTRLSPRLAALESWTIELPPFSSEVEVLGLDVPLRIEVGYGRTGTYWAYAEEIGAGERMARPLPLANGCSLLRVTNRGTSVAAPVALFTLSV